MRNHPVLEFLNLADSISYLVTTRFQESIFPHNQFQNTGSDCTADPLTPHEKPNSWAYNFIEVSGHNLESSQTWGFSILYNVYITNQFQATFAHGGREGVKSVSRTVNSKDFKTFVPIASKNSASGNLHLAFMSVKPTHIHICRMLNPDDRFSRFYCFPSPRRVFVH